MTHVCFEGEERTLRRREPISAFDPTRTLSLLRRPSTQRLDETEIGKGPAMLVDPAGASRENARRDGSLTCPGPRLCLRASHLYASGCSDARAWRHLGYRHGG